MREAAKNGLIPEVYGRHKHPFTTLPTRDKNDPMLVFYRDTFASQAAKGRPIYDIKKASAALDQLLEWRVDRQRWRAAPRSRTRPSDGWPRQCSHRHG